MTNPYEQDLDRNAANLQPLTPITIWSVPRRSFRTIPRSSMARAASAIATTGAAASSSPRRSPERHRQGRHRSVMHSNTPAMLEAHFGVPKVKAVLHSMNTRLDAAIIAFQLDHAETKVLIVDREFPASSRRRWRSPRSSR